MSYYRRQIEMALEAVRIHSPINFSWLGKMTARLPRSVVRELSDKTARSFLFYSLQTHFYSNFYCRGFTIPSVREKYRVTGTSESLGFIKSLEFANKGHGHWDGGWTIIECRDERFVLEKDHFRIQANKEDCQPEGTDSAKRFRLLFPKALISISPGFYMATSNTPFDDSQADLRLYWNLIPSGSARLLEVITTHLNCKNIPYRLKVLNDPARYDRCDAGVLYVRSRDYPNLELDLIYSEIRDYLKPMAPTFTKPLAPGLSLAEDPGGGQSFGLHRCSLLADGVIRAFDLGKRSVSNQFDEVLARFSTEGLSVEHPYLNKGSKDRYLFRAGSPPTGKKHDESSTRRPILTPQHLLETADSIGQQIVKGVIRHHDLCNWVGVVPMDPTADSLTVAHKSLGPDLYGGVAGIGLFLAELSIATDNADYRDLALRAIRCAFKQVNSVEPRYRLSLYIGWVSIAYAAVYVGILLKEFSLIQPALQLLKRAMGTCSEIHEHDLLAGSAGAIVGFVTLHQFLPHDGFLDFASKLGDELITKAEGNPEDGYSWPSPENPRQPNLLGFSHGAAGIAYALNELTVATSLDKYKRVASLAFCYEKNWFQPASANWPDFRELSRSDLRHKSLIPSGTLWCHGAPGIALSRLRANQLFGEDAFLEDATVALNTTRVAIEGWLANRNGNFCLCHGLAGNADILLHASRQLNYVLEKKNMLAIVGQVAHTGYERHVRDNLPWPCGTAVGQTPALMLGLAGIGLFYLRQKDLRIPSILILEPEAIREYLTGNTKTKS